MVASRRSSKAVAGLLIVSVDSFDRARRSQATPVRRHFDTKVFYERGNSFLAFPSHESSLGLLLFLSFFLSLSNLRESVSPD